MIFHEKNHPNLGDPHTVGSPAAACVTGATPRGGAGGFGPWTAIFSAEATRSLW